MATTATTDRNGVILGPTPPGIPHFAVPFSVGTTGAVTTVQQGSLTDVLECVANVCGTRPGTRLMVPKFGTPDPTFVGVAAADLEARIRQWETRGSVTVTTQPGTSEQVTVSVSLAGAA